MQTVVRARPISIRILIVLYLMSLIIACNDSVPVSSFVEAGTAAARKIDALNPNEAGEVKFQGLVVENDVSCEVDGLCLLRVHVEEQLVTVIYHFGEWPPCENDRATQQGFEIAPNDLVEIHGSIHEGSAISTCESESYYIRRISED